MAVERLSRDRLRDVQVTVVVGKGCWPCDCEVRRRFPFAWKRRMQSAWLSFVLPLVVLLPFMSCLSDPVNIVEDYRNQIVPVESNAAATVVDFQAFQVYST